MIERVQAVITRQAAKRDKHRERALKVAEVVGQTVTREKFLNYKSRIKPYEFCGRTQRRWDSRNVRLAMCL